MRMIYPRMDELLADYGWSNEFTWASDVGGGVDESASRVWAMVDGRKVSFHHWPARRWGYSWCCIAAWRSGIPRRQRRQVEKRTAEFVALALEPSERRVLESAPHPTQMRVEDRFLAGSGVHGA